MTAAARPDAAITRETEAATGPAPRFLLLSGGYGYPAGGAAKPRCARKPGALSLSRPTAS